MLPQKTQGTQRKLKFQKNKQRAGRADPLDYSEGGYSSGTISNATILIILIMGLIAGPAVSL